MPRLTQTRLVGILEAQPVNMEINLMDRDNGGLATSAWGEKQQLNQTSRYFRTRASGGPKLYQYVIPVEPFSHMNSAANHLDNLIFSFCMPKHPQIYNTGYVVLRY